VLAVVCADETRGAGPHLHSYFPAAAAVELGFFKNEGLDVELELIFPVDKCYAAPAQRRRRLRRRIGALGARAFPAWTV